MSMRDRPIHPPSEDLFAYRDGELSPEKRALIEAHVMGCSTCRSFIDQVSSLEAELRQSPDRAPAEYLERLHETVRARIVASGPPGEDVEELAAVAGPSPALGHDRRASSRLGGRERRGESAGTAGENVRVKEAPRLPWAAVFSTASAAAAVLVVVVILMRQGFDHRAPLPEPSRVGGAKPDRDLKAGTAAGKKSTGQDKQGYLEKNKDQGTLGAEKPVEEKREALRLNRARTNPEPGEVGKVAATGEAGPAEAESVGKNAPQEAVREEKSSDEGTRQRADAAVPAVPAPQALTAPPATSDELQAQSPYDALMQRLGIPPVWDGSRVTPEALERAEPELRALYVSGGAGQDSARIRLYLAEAVRARYTPGDSVAYEEIEHHYKRAIALSKGDVKTARVAAERLQTLQK